MILIFILFNVAIAWFPMRDGIAPDAGAGKELIQFISIICFILNYII